MLSALSPLIMVPMAFSLPSFNFDYSTMAPEQIVCAFIALGVSIGMAVHWVAKAGTAARWALNSSS